MRRSSACLDSCVLLDIRGSNDCGGGTGGSAVGESAVTTAEVWIGTLGPAGPWA